METTASLELRSSLEQIARDWNTSFNEMGNGIFRLDVPIQGNEGEMRYQYVFAHESSQFAKGKDVYYINSRAGVVNPGTNLYQMLKEASLGVYSMVTIVPDKDGEGNSREVLLVQASPVKEFTNSYEELKFIVEEVAKVADYLEAKYFGGDNF